MRYIFIILLFCGFCLAADNNDVNTLSDTVVSMKAELPQREKQLAEKEYFGTISDIIQERIEDVNGVYKFSKDLNDKAVQACQKMGLKADRTQAIDKIIKVKKQKIENRKQNAEIIKFVTELIKDPNMLPDPNAPNYAYEVEKNHEFLLAVMESCQPW
jgi:hypothetical protein